MTRPRKPERADVERKLAGKVLCAACGASLETFGEACTADLADMCDGFVCIELCYYPDARNLVDTCPPSQIDRCRKIVEAAR